MLFALYQYTSSAIFPSWEIEEIKLRDVNDLQRQTCPHKNGDMRNIRMENFVIGRALFFVPLSISLSMQ